ncbi:unnamed protein product [Clavelina lepadiformis]|uniref:Uncharacterized protein n=1 Tax=Clavelina lepadiformis TaxID=159417 RepID=A0ABP0G7S5_CLALP
MQSSHLVTKDQLHAKIIMVVQLCCTNFGSTPTPNIITIIWPQETGLPPGMGFLLRWVLFSHPLMYSIGPIKDQQSVA